MASVAVFIFAQCLASGYACLRGGAPERLIAVLLLLAMSWAAALPHDASTSYHGVYWALVRVDLVLFVCLTGVALLADRYWPMGIAALQLLALMAHGVKGYDHGVLAIAYWLVVGKTAYFMLAVMIIGTVRHRDRQRLGLPEYAWSFRRHADEAANRFRDTKA
ncbi:hypothetical protein [Sphingomonas qomolangmaensis]|uniref:Uncharacterized protein n=1 Tax=Sphingomonas qomolangmaensis TaxID=2918765 RepID=A0ABY5L6I5_9SPHN|nr:hypothetical protein [Sphingomonas qomolangmaensis]UUL82570.1 hypothetical protein NMP03_15590 [Sphingomonas qomolangmaensis]